MRQRKLRLGETMDEIAPSAGATGPKTELVQYSLSYALRTQVLAVVGAIPFAGFPIWWGLLISDRHYDLLSFGLAQTAQLCGWLATNVLLLIFLYRVHRSRLAALSFALIGCSYLAVIFIGDVRILIVGLGIQAAASGATSSLAAIYTGHTRNPERQYSIQITATTVLQSFLVLVIPQLFRFIGNNGIQIVYAAILLIGAVIVFGLPADLPKTRENSQDALDHERLKMPVRSVWWAGVPILVASSVFAGFLAVIYNYSERIGALRNLSVATSGSVLAVGMLIGSVGAALGIGVGKRAGHVLPVVVGALLGCIMFALLRNTATGLAGFTGGIVLFSIIYNFVQPYISAQMMAIDPSGRISIASGLSVAVGGVTFAALATWLSVTYGVSGVLWIALAEILICPLFVGLSALLARPEVVRMLRKRLAVLVANSRKESEILSHTEQRCLVPPADSAEIPAVTSTSVSAKTSAGGRGPG
jgi:hypothetical protein